MFKVSFSFIVLLISMIPVKAFPNLTDTIQVVQIGQEEGLSQLGATSLQFDNNGYLWIGTQNGLNRFNGVEMKVWLADEGNDNFPNDFIRAMFQENDTLWMTTHTHALCAYLLKENRFIHFSEQLDFSTNPSLRHSLALHVAADRRLIVGVAGHCLLFDRASLRYNVLQVPQLLEHDFVTCIEALDDRYYLIGTNASGLYILDIVANEIFTHEAFDSFGNSQVNAFYPRADGMLWVATGKGIYVLNPITKSLSFHDKHVIRSIHHWADGILLMGGVNMSYLLSHDTEWREIVFVDHNRKKIVADVLAFHEDMQGGKWIGTESRGIFYYHPLQTKFVPHRVESGDIVKDDFVSVFGFLRDHDDLWLATEFGFARHRLKTPKYDIYKTNFVGYTLVLDSTGGLWGGGYDQGLLRYSRQRDRFDPVSVPFVDRDVIHITPVTKDSIWIHTLSSGLYAMHTVSMKVDPVNIFGKPLLGSRIAHVDRRRTIWVGSEDGIYEVRHDRSVVYHDSLSNERVFAIAEDSAGDIWVGTAKGLNRINRMTGHIRHYTKQTGLPNDFIYGVQIDQRNHVWVSTNYGVSVLNPRTNTFINYSQDDGLQNNEFNGKASYQDSLGFIYFGGMNGFNIFHPDSIKVNKHRGKTHIEDVLLFGKSIHQNVLYSDTLYFSHDQNVITFEFVNLNYLWPRKNRYQFILEGFDLQWRPMTREMSATYTNLDPGTYHFKVRGSNNELLWGDYDEMVIIISSPWYHTVWFRIIVALAFVGSIVAFFWYKAYQQRRVNSRLLGMVAIRTDELNQSNKELNESLKLTHKQKEDISFLMDELNHRVKNNLQLITSLIDIQRVQVRDEEEVHKWKALQSKVYTVAKIHDLLNHTDADNTVNAEPFIRGLAHDIIAFSGTYVALAVHVDDFSLSTRKLTYVGLVINELITNSLKHAFNGRPEKKIAISMTCIENGLLLEFRDNGVGFHGDNAIQNRNKGINLIHLLVKEMQGEVHCYNDGGAVYRIRLTHKTS